MLAVPRTFTTITPVVRTFINFYSTVSGLKRRNWRIASGGTTPQSLTSDVESPYGGEDDEASIASSSLPSGNGPRSKVRTPRAFAAHRQSMKEAFPEGWLPRRKLSRDAMDGLRSMHAMHPETFSTPVLAEKFRISPEAVRRILRSKWTPSREERARLLDKERKARAVWITKQRLEERDRLIALTRERDRLDRMLGKVRGVNSKDKLSLS